MSQTVGDFPIFEHKQLSTKLINMCHPGFATKFLKYWAPTEDLFEDFISQIHHDFDHDIDLF